MKKLLIILLLFMTSSLFASNLKISSGNVSNFYAGSTEISFTVSQENTFSTNTYIYSSDPVKDCAWIFVKYSLNGDSGPWNHCTITGTSAGDDASTTIQSVSDNKGVFLFSNGNNSSWKSNYVKVQWNFVADGIGTFPSSGVKFKVMGIEMVYISTGTFLYNAGSIADSTINNFGGGSQVTVGSITDVPAGCANDWPNGYRAFYLAKYEISQKQYVDFLNAVDPYGTTGTAYYDSVRYNLYGYYVQSDNSRPIGDRYYIASERDTLGCNWLSWSDATAYASWSGLRPMTEMEFERAGRGRNNANIYPWGNTDPLNVNSVDTKSEAEKCWLYYANCDQFSGSNGPTSVGHYLSGLNISGAPQVRTAAQTGASPYGIVDLGGNLWEHIINCQSIATPTNGNGTTTIPDVPVWPSYISAGLRGGAWDDAPTRMRVSDRENAGWAEEIRAASVGFRPARTP